MLAKLKQVNPDAKHRHPLPTDEIQSSMATSFYQNGVKTTEQEGIVIVGTSKPRSKAQSSQLSIISSPADTYRAKEIEKICRPPDEMVIKADFKPNTMSEAA